MYKEKKPLGEFVIVMEGKSNEELEIEKQEGLVNITIEEHIKSYIAGGMDKKEAIKSVAQDRNIPKSEIYKHSLNYSETRPMMGQRC